MFIIDVSLQYLVITICVPGCLCVSLHINKKYLLYSPLLFYDHFKSNLRNFTSFPIFLQASSIAARTYFHPAFVLFTVWDHMQYQEVFYRSCSR